MFVIAVGVAPPIVALVVAVSVPALRLVKPLGVAVHAGGAPPTMTAVEAAQATAEAFPPETKSTPVDAEKSAPRPPWAGVTGFLSEDAAPPEMI